MVALQEGERPDPGVVLAHELDRPGGGIYLPDRLDQGVHRDRVLGMFLGQFQKPQCELIAEPEHVADELHSLRVGQGTPTRRRLLVLLQKRLVLLGRRGWLLLAVSLGRNHGQAEQKD
jgi:hypothetical protein